jgi:hypothetical protein
VDTRELPRRVALNEDRGLLVQAGASRGERSAIGAAAPFLFEGRDARLHVRELLLVVLEHLHVGRAPAL